MNAAEVVRILRSAVGIRVPAAKRVGIGVVKELHLLLTMLDRHRRQDHEVKCEEELAPGERGDANLAARLVHDAPGVPFATNRRGAALVHAIAVEVGVSELLDRQRAGLRHGVGECVQLVNELRGRRARAPVDESAIRDAEEDGLRLESVRLCKLDVAVQPARVHRIDLREAHRRQAVVLGDVLHHLRVARARAVEAEIEALSRIVLRLRFGQV